MEHDIPAYKRPLARPGNTGPAGAEAVALSVTRSRNGSVHLQRRWVDWIRWMVGWAGNSSRNGEYTETEGK